ncbi:head-tail connector protein [Candidatus Pacearchaeota archaeon]|nr:head-tail connector protein [Candidatus Pacearchaeota archaeon]
MPKLTKDDVEWHCNRVNSLYQNRANFDSQWQEIAERIYPEHANFTTLYTPGEKRMSKVYDSAAIHANQLLSSGLFSLLTSSANQWAQFMPVDLRLTEIREVAIYLDAVSKIMYHEINKSSAGFSTAAHESYLSFGSFGNLCMFIEEIIEQDSLSFLALPLYECYAVENQYNRIDTLYRKYERTVEQLVRRFGKENLSTDVQEFVKDNKLDKKIDCFHVIMPRETGIILGHKSTDKPYASVYIEKKHQHVIHEGGYDELPFMFARFYKESFETYGRGPGGTALPDTKMLMKVAQVTIRSAQKTVDPALILPDAGFLRPVRTTPGGLNFYRKGRLNTKNDIDVFPTGNAGLGIEYSESLHKRIREAFYVDQLQLHEGPQMTATEVMQRTEEKLRLMGPLLGRIQTELLGPMISRVYGLLQRAGKFPPLPEVMIDQPIKIVYTSPIARAQEQVEANGLMRALGLLEPIFKYKPNSMDVLNEDEITRGIFDMFSISQRFTNEEGVVEAIRKRRAEAEKAKQDAENLRASGQGADSMVRAEAAAKEAGLTEEDFGTLQ